MSGAGPVGDPGGFTVRAQDLLTHAGHVDAVGDQVGVALDAANTTTPGSDAYGQLCTIVPQLLGMLQHKVVAALDGGQQALHHTATELRDAADGYQGTDQHNATVIHKAAGS
jgi:hypothetical protein